MSKALYSLILLLTFIVVIELGIVYFIHNPKTLSYLKAFKVLQSKVDDKKVNTIRIEKPSAKVSAKAVDQSKNLDTMEYQTGLLFSEGIKTGLLVSSISTDFYRGKIGKIEKKDDATQLILENDKGTITFYYKDSDIEKAQISESRQKAEKRIVFADLKQGDNIEIKAVYDVTKQWKDGVVEIVIKKLN